MTLQHLIMSTKMFYMFFLKIPFNRNRFVAFPLAFVLPINSRCGICIGRWSLEYQRCETFSFFFFRSFHCFLYPFIFWRWLKSNKLCAGVGQENDKLMIVADLIQLTNQELNWQSVIPKLSGKVLGPPMYCQEDTLQCQMELNSQWLQSHKVWMTVTIPTRTYPVSNKYSMPKMSQKYQLKNQSQWLFFGWLIFYFHLCRCFFGGEWVCKMSDVLKVFLNGKIFWYLIFFLICVCFRFFFFWY